MIRITWIACLIAMTLSPVVSAQDKSPPSNGESTDKVLSPLRKLMDESLTWYELSLNDQSAQPMVPRVVMRWANNTRGSEDGMTVMYLLAGRPEAVCCLYPWDKSLQHNFESMSRGTLIAKRNGTTLWHPKKPGVDFKPIPDAPVPADTPAARLRQMKSLASQFSSTMLGWRADSSDRESLRLLPQPLYRYESQRSDILDGGVFAFVQGTDPESLLLIEAFKRGDSFEWQYAFVRRTSGELEGRFKDTVVWHADRYPANNDPNSTYVTFSQPLISTTGSAVIGR